MLYLEMYTQGGRYIPSSLEQGGYAATGVVYGSRGAWRASMQRSCHVGDQGPRKNSGSHIDASHSRQPLVKGERLVRYEVNAVMPEVCKQAGLPKVSATRLVSAARTCKHPVAGGWGLLRGAACCCQKCLTATKDDVIVLSPAPSLLSCCRACFR